MTFSSSFRCIFVPWFVCSMNLAHPHFSQKNCLSACEMTRGKSSQRPCSKSVFCKARPRTHIKSVSKERNLNSRSIGHEASQMMIDVSGTRVLAKTSIVPSSSSLHWFNDVLPNQELVANGECFVLAHDSSRNWKPSKHYDGDIPKLFNSDATHGCTIIGVMVR